MKSKSGDWPWLRQWLLHDEVFVYHQHQVPGAVVARPTEA